MLEDDHRQTRRGPVYRLAFNDVVSDLLKVKPAATSERSPRRVEPRGYRPVVACAARLPAGDAIRRRGALLARPALGSAGPQLATGPVGIVARRSRAPSRCSIAASSSVSCGRSAVCTPTRPISGVITGTVEYFRKQDPKRMERLWHRILGHQAGLAVYRLRDAAVRSRLEQTGGAAAGGPIMADDRSSTSLRVRRGRADRRITRRPGSSRASSHSRSSGRSRRRSSDGRPVSAGPSPSSSLSRLGVWSRIGIW